MMSRPESFHNSSSKSRGKRIFIFLISFGFFFCLTIIGSLAWTIYGLSKDTQDIHNSVSTLVNDNGALRMIADDMNGIRAVLNLPLREYYKPDTSLDTETAPDTDPNQILANQIIASIQKIGSQELDKQKKQDLLKNCRSFLDSDVFREKAEQNKAALQYFPEKNGIYRVATIFKDLPVESFNTFVFTVNSVEGSCIIERPTNNIAYNDFDKFHSEVEVHLSTAEETFQDMTKMEEGKNNIEIFLKDEKVVQIAKQKNMVLVPEQGIIQTSDNQRLLSLSYSDDTYSLTRGSLMEGRENIENFEAFKTKVLEELNTIDASTQQEKKQREAREIFANLMKDPGFLGLLSSQKLSLDDAPVEETDRFYYYIKTQDGTRLASIIIEKGSGDILVGDLKGTNAVSLEEFLDNQDAKKKSLEIPQTFDLLKKPSKKGLNILLAGKHQNLVDTIMYAHVDSEAQKITLLSIPRDLYVDERKINSFDRLFGTKVFLKKLEELTGYPIDYYAFIDMYAFIDVIDALGGVDVTLTKPVIDPTYKVQDNGKWGTLFYDVGTHHVSGRQALRIARSRHSTSDFDRAARQQIILDGLRKKAQGLSVQDVASLLSLVKKIFSYVETNIQPQQALVYYLQFRDFTLDTGNVLSTGNVLVSKHTKDDEIASLQASCNLLEDAIRKQECLKNVETLGKGEYVLLPKENDWRAITWYVSQIFEGK